ncbi:hypothetical protein P7K49_004137 [Saguinus oedipus]|uniref:Uncharacterized protein n=1 Tax=Saguinus oedipus TaxID=9490 RepID=A0ABQ9W6I7_SAGOE|nr:hypothetical protein P7K49_004137 [Saguinus oedipus]
MQLLSHPLLASPIEGQPPWATEPSSGSASCGPPGLTLFAFPPTAKPPFLEDIKTNGMVSRAYFCIPGGPRLEHKHSV